MLPLALITLAAVAEPDQSSTKNLMPIVLPTREYQVVVSGTVLSHKNIYGEPLIGFDEPGVVPCVGTLLTVRVDRLLKGSLEEGGEIIVDWPACRDPEVGLQGVAQYLTMPRTDLTFLMFLKPDGHRGPNVWHPAEWTYWKSDGHATSPTQHQGRALVWVDGSIYKSEHHLDGSRAGRPGENERRHRFADGKPQVTWDELLEATAKQVGAP